MKQNISSQKSRIIFILITMFLNFLGFSIIFPIVPFMVQYYVSDQSQIAFFVGLLLSTYALCQFFSAPGLGVLSDRFGRKPILLISLFGSVVGYILLGIGGALWVLFLGRIIDGLTGGNISTIYAYMADITKPKERGKYFGFLGAAKGVGMVFGPVIGGFTSIINISIPLYIAAIITLLDLIFGYFILTESIAKEHRIEKIKLTQLNPFKQFRNVLSVKIIKRIFLVGFLYFVAINAMYGTNGVFLKDVFLWTPVQIGILFFIVGLVDIVTQGFMVRKLLHKFSDTNVAIIGLIITFIGFIMAASTAIFVYSKLIYLGVIILNIGDGVFEPSVNSLISTSVGPKSQGQVQGANQSMQSVARIVGPFIAAWAYQYWKGVPYAIGSILMIASLLVIYYSIDIIKNHKFKPI